MGPMVRGSLNHHGKNRRQVIQGIIDQCAEMGKPCTWEEARNELRGNEKNVWVNEIYTVFLRRNKGPEGWPDKIHLSIKTHDKRAVRDWRHFQEIKNQLVGKEIEMVELYPAESRLVDTANQYHLWGFDATDFRFPVGFSERLVTDKESHGSKQRPREGDGKEA